MTALAQIADIISERRCRNAHGRRPQSLAVPVDLFERASKEIHCTGELLWNRPPTQIVPDDMFVFQGVEE